MTGKRKEKDGSVKEVLSIVNFPGQPLAHISGFGSSFCPDKYARNSFIGTYRRNSDRIGL